MMYRTIRKLLLHPNLIIYDYLRKKLGFKKYFVTDKVKLLNNSNHQKWQKLLLTHPYLYLYYKISKRLHVPAYPILVDLRIETLNTNIIGGRDEREVLAVELDNKNIIYFADPEVLQKVHDDKEPYLVDKIFKFIFKGCSNEVFIGSGVIFGESFQAIFRGNSNSIYINSRCKFNGGLLELKGNGNIFVSMMDCILMSNARIVFTSDYNCLYLGPRSIIHPSAIINFLDNKAVSYFMGHQNIKQSIELTMGSIFFHGGNSTNINMTQNIYKLYEGKNIIIGCGTKFSSRILIRTSDNHLIYDKNSLKRLNTGKSIIIGDHVWIGHDNMIFKGAKIKDGCVIGAGSIVTNQLIPENCICAGRPATIKKKNIIWEHTIPIHFTKDELADLETYNGSPPCKFTHIGFEKLMQIDAINPEACAKEKLEIIERIIK